MIKGLNLPSQGMEYWGPGTNGRQSLVAFIINLWIPIWIIVNWVDNVLLSLLYENQGWLDSVFDMGYVLASLLTLSLYTAIPMLASFYIYTATADHVTGQGHSKYCLHYPRPFRSKHPTSTSIAS